MADLPRERLHALGPEALSDAELLSLLLRTGAPGSDVLTGGAYRVLSQAPLRITTDTNTIPHASGGSQTFTAELGPANAGRIAFLFGSASGPMPGVTIGDGAIIGAHAVVTREVRPYAIVAGNPAREVKRRFDDATVAELLEIRWWDWDIAKITRNIQVIGDGRPDQLRECE